MKVKPLHDNILVKRVEEQEKTKGGIYIPDSAKEKQAEGLVKAVGSGRIGKDGKVKPLAVKVGDRILFQKYAGTDVKVGGEEFIIMDEDSVMAIIEGGSKKKK